MYTLIAGFDLGKRVSCCAEKKTGNNHKRPTNKTMGHASLSHSECFVGVRFVSCQFLKCMFVARVMKYMYLAASKFCGGWAGVPKKFSCLPRGCMASRERGAVAYNQNIILGLPRQYFWVSKFCFTWCSGFITGICLVLWLLLGTCIAL